MNFELSEEQLQVKYSIREFAESEIKPHVMEWDEAQHFPEELRPKLAELGLMGILFPEEYGGAGMGYVEYATIIEELGRVCGSVALSVAAHNSLCSNHIYMFGDEAQKQKYLLPLTTGESFGAWGLTESQAGSDSAGTRTNAVRTDAGWKVNGSKNFITHALVCNTLVAVAVTDKEKEIAASRPLYSINRWKVSAAIRKKTNLECVRPRLRQLFSKIALLPTKTF